MRKRLISLWRHAKFAECERAREVGTRKEESFSNWNCSIVFGGQEFGRGKIFIGCIGAPKTKFNMVMI